MKIKNILLILATVIPMCLIANINPYLKLIMIRILISCIMAIGANIYTSVSGEISLGQGGFMALGAYVTGKIMCSPQSSTYLLPAIILSVLVTVAVSYFLGYFILRLNGDYLAIATMALGEVFILFFQVNEHFGKAKGLYGIEKFSTIFLAITLFLISFYIAKKFKNSKTGFLSLVTGKDEIASKSIGINTMKHKIIPFVISAVVCSLAGVLYSGTLGFISPTDFNYSRSVDCVASVVLGGKKSVLGAVIAAAIIELTTIVLQPMAEYRMILYGILLIFFAKKRYAKVGD